MLIVCFATDSSYTEAKVAITSNYMLVLQGYLYLFLSRGVNGGDDSQVQVVHQLTDHDSVHDPLTNVV